MLYEDCCGCPLVKKVTEPKNLTKNMSTIIIFTTYQLVIIHHASASLLKVRY